MEYISDKYVVAISEKAANMLVQHVVFLARVNTQAADRLRQDIIDGIKSLEFYPDRNPWLKDTIITAYKYRKLIIKNRYLIIYQIKEQSVYVDYIADCRQDYKWLL